jgi:type IX secretion system PorP/SprF family membrane protein
MKRQLLVLSALILSIPLWVSGQQAPQYSLHAFNLHAYNPAYAGLGSSLEAAGMFRKQWTGLEGSPMTQHLNVHLPVLYLSSGVGLNMENDMLGAVRNSKVTLSYAYHLKLGDGFALSIGVGGGLLQRSFDGTKLLAPGGLYEGTSFEHNDNFLPETKQTALTYTMEAGVYAKTEALDVGFSALYLTEPKVDFDFSEGEDFRYRRHYTGFAAYRIAAGDWGIRPTIFAKTDLTQAQIDFSVSLDYDRRYVFGIAYRGYNKTTQDALGLHGGLRLTKHWMLIYGYDFSLSALNAVNNGSHEVMLKYELGKTFGEGHPPKIIHTPRLL